MSNLLNLASNPLLPLLIALPLLYLAFNFPKKTKLSFYVHDYLSGGDTTAITVAGKDGPATSVMRFGTLVALDDPVTVGPDPKSKEIGRAQGMYMNSQLDGKSLYLLFSVMFNDGDYKGSTIQIQGVDPFSVKEREFSVVSGTGFSGLSRAMGL